MTNFSLKISSFARWVGIRNISDYSPFGVLLAERTVEGAFYRNGFQGQERDDEVKGDGNSVNFSYRMHDPRVGRWLSCDAHKPNYPAWAPYASNGDNPIVNFDIDGQDFIFFAGAGYKGEKEEKKFNTSFTSTMSEILDDNFSIVPGVNRGGLRDVFWGIKNGWTPISNLTSNEILQRSVDHVERVIQGLECGEPLNMVGSSYGSVTAAQTALYILEHKEEYLQNDVKVSLTLSSKMLDENSPLMLALINEARNNPNFTLLFQNFPEDNVNGIASGKILGNQGLKSIIFPHKQADGTRQDSMLNPNGDHTHTVMGQSTAKTHDLIKFMLYENQLEGLATAERSLTILGQNSNLPDRKDPECLDTILESPSKNHSVPKY